MGILKTGHGDPTHDRDEGAIDVYEATISLDASGAGSTTVSWDEEFRTANPKLIVSASDGTAGWSARGASEATVTVSGGTADSDSTVSLLVIGQR